MKFDTNSKILIVGLGLIGGSYAQALSQKGYEIGAIDTREDSIEFALQKGWIVEGRTGVDKDFVSRYDLIVFALYPHVLIEWVEKYQSYIKRGALLTDVTGVKGNLVGAVQNILREDLEFVGAHPMAGRETSGVRNAKADIFKGANYIVTPTQKNTQEGIEACKALGRELGFERIGELSPEKHDETVGFLSHLTHCIAVSLMVCKDDHEHLAEYTGDSFKDLTRIAKINDEMWSELFLANKEQLIAQMELFEKQFDMLKQDIKEDNVDNIRQMMRLSTQRRGEFDKDAEEK